MSAEDLDQIHEELVVDQVYVHPSLRSMVSEADEAALEAQVTAAPQTTFIVMWPFQSGDEYGGKASDLLTRLHDRHPEDGVYLATTERLEDMPGDEAYTNIDLAGRQWGIPGEQDGEVAFRLTSTIGMEGHPDLTSAFERSLELLEMPADELDALHQEVLDDHSAAYRAENPPSSDDDGTGAGVVGGVMTALVVLVTAVALWRVVTSFRMQQKPAALPRSAMDRIRQAKDRELTARAQREVQELGDLLDDEEIASGDHRGAWQAALDHYAEARRALDSREEPDVLDVVGAIVLAERGQAAFASARAGRPFQPTVLCFLNPLHGPASKDRKITWDGRLIDVPVCNPCRSALRRQAIPDILDVVRRGQPKHYFETDAEPWASSGYGALEPDLIPLLHKTRRHHDS